MEVIVTAIVAIVLITVGIIALSYFYITTHSVLSGIKVRLFTYSLESILAGIPARLSIPYLKCYTTNIEIKVVRKTVSGKELVTVYKIYNAIEEAYWPNNCTAPPVTPWLRASSVCIAINFTTILKEDYDQCLTRSKCMIKIYVLEGNRKTLANYITTSTRDIIIDLSSSTSELEIEGLGSQFQPITGPGKVVFVRIIFLKPGPYIAGG